VSGIDCDSGLGSGQHHDFLVNWLYGVGWARCEAADLLSCSLSGEQADERSQMQVLMLD
jgi:hypothetical protein